MTEALKCAARWVLWPASRPLCCTADGYLSFLDLQPLFLASTNFFLISHFQIPRWFKYNRQHVWSLSKDPHPRDGRVRATHRPVSRPYPCPIYFGNCFKQEQSADNHNSFINNEFVKSVDGKTFDVINPSTEEVICAVQEASEKDVDIAVSTARKAFNGEWRKATPATRGKYLVKLADLFEKNADLLASVEALDNGKAFSMARDVDVVAAAGCLRYYGGWADKIEGKVVDTAPDTFNYIRKEPVSVPRLWLDTGN
jgi:hypothetical protein